MPARCSPQVRSSGKHPLAAAVGASILLVTGCTGQVSGSPSTVLQTVTATTTVTQTQTVTAVPLVSSPPASGPLLYPSGDELLPGYPVLVSRASLDSRVASWLKSKEVVALAPGVYAAYTSAVPDLGSYLDGPVDGDCAVIRRYFPQAAGSCWSGVQPSAQEPQP